MQLECSDEPLACSVGPPGTPSSVICATVEGREILRAANTSAAVKDNVAHGDGRLRPRGQPLSFSDCARGPAFSRGLVHVVSSIERSERNGSHPNRRRAYRGVGIANT
jgi:hypothetical protein